MPKDIKSISYKLILFYDSINLLMTFKNIVNREIDSQHAFMPVLCIFAKLQKLLILMSELTLEEIR